MTVSNMTIGEKIKAVRLKRGLSQEELHRRSGVQRNFISLVENNRRGISFQTLSRVAQALGVSPGYIADYTRSELYYPVEDTPEATPAIADDLIQYTYPMAYLTLFLQDENNPYASILVHRDWLPVPQEPYRYLCFYLRDEAQALPPLITSGALVCIDRKERNPKKLVSQIVAFKLDDTFQVRRLYLSGPQILGLPESPSSSQPIIIPQGQRTKIGGQVVWYINRLVLSSPK